MKRNSYKKFMTWFLFIICSTSEDIGIKMERPVDCKGKWENGTMDSPCCLITREYGWTINMKRNPNVVVGGRLRLLEVLTIFGYWYVFVLVRSFFSICFCSYQRSLSIVAEFEWTYFPFCVSLLINICSHESNMYWKDWWNSHHDGF